MRYEMNQVVSFCKTDAPFGGLSNMARGYSMVVANHFISHAEHLYQVCRFPDHPQVQRMIISQRSPMTAKQISRKYNSLTRSGWDDIRLDIMKWVLKVKLIQNWAKFSELLLSTGDFPIVELSYKDTFWGAKPVGNLLIGHNHLGHLLEELRGMVKSEEIKAGDEVTPPEGINNFRLNGAEIGIVSPKKSLSLSNKNYQKSGLDVS